MVLLLLFSFIGTSCSSPSPLAAITPTTPIQPTESKAGYQTQDLGTPYYSTGFTQASFDAQKWLVIDSEGQIRYRGEDDTYQFDVQAPSNATTGLYMDGRNAFTNSIIEVEVKILEGNGRVEIVCRMTGLMKINSNYNRGYIASFHNNGLVTINFVQTDENQALTHVWYAELKFGAHYRLRFDCIDENLTAYEDGVKILEYQDSTIDV
jgi:hypothetical protein